MIASGTPSDPFAAAQRHGADAAGFLELHRRWAAVQQEWVDAELAARARADAGDDDDDEATRAAADERLEDIVGRADFLLRELERAPVRSMADVAALLDAAIDYSIEDLPGLVDPTFRADAPLLWKLIETLADLTGHDFGSLRRRAALHVED